MAGTAVTGRDFVNHVSEHKFGSVRWIAPGLHIESQVLDIQGLSGLVQLIRADSLQIIAHQQLGNLHGI